MGGQNLKRELALDLHAIGAVKFGEFTYKSGVVGPIYIDLRLFISYPKILKKVAKLYAAQLESLQYDRLAGVAYAALPITQAISLEIEKPWIFLRKESLKKEYGLQKSLEGEYKQGEIAVVIEDLVNQAISILEVISALQDQGLIIKDAVVLLDYEKGGREKLWEKDCTLHAFMTVSELLDIMYAEGKIDSDKHRQSIDFLKA